MQQKLKAMVHTARIWIISFDEFFDSAFCILSENKMLKTIFNEFTNIKLDTLADD